MGEYSANGLPIIDGKGRSILPRFLSSESFILQPPPVVAYSDVAGFAATDYPFIIDPASDLNYKTVEIPTDAQYIQVRVPRFDSCWLAFTAGEITALSEYNVNASIPGGMLAPPNTAPSPGLLLVDCYARDLIPCFAASYATLQAISYPCWVNVCFFGAQ